MTEKQIEQALKDHVKSLGGLCIKLLPFQFAGLPDRMCLLPGAKIVFVELKAPGKTCSKLQMKVHKMIRDLGFTVLVIDSLENVKNVNH